MRNTEKEILARAIEQFEELTGYATEIKQEFKLPKNKIVDARVRIPKIKVNFYAEIKINITNQTLGAVVHQIKELTKGGNELLITHYVTPQIAERLKGMNMQFLDTAGNAFINLPNLFLYIKGNKTKEDFVREKPVRAFQPAGLQLIYALICNPGLENKPYRMMAEKAMIANGAVTLVVKDLKKLGYLIDMGKQGRRIINKKELLNRWVNLYAELLRPKLLLGIYRTDNTDWWKQQDITNIKGLYGGETAAALLTKYLKPQNHTIYAEKNYGKLLLQLKLKNDPHGNVEVLEKFWNFNDVMEKNNIVNPVLIYADLLATGDNRNIETAKLVYDKEVIRYIRED
ncbi:MAG: type IV toxin-antitoxin system AbiEi family antitoxin [Ignavibacteria bacterium]|nr:type IV toxin-antitoxin system AbiEi family antitoxin [Ignavibacteria bacterium]